MRWTATEAAAAIDPEAGHRRAATLRRESRDCAVCRTPNEQGLGVPVTDYLDPLRGAVTICYACVLAIEEARDADG